MVINGNYMLEKRINFFEHELPEIDHELVINYTRLSQVCENDDIQSPTARRFSSTTEGKVKLPVRSRLRREGLARRPKGKSNLSNLFKSNKSFITSSLCL